MHARAFVKYSLPVFACLISPVSAHAGILDFLHGSAPVQPAGPALPVTPVTSGNGASYSPAADKIAFAHYDATIKGGVSLEGQPSYTGTFELWTANADGTEERCLSCFDIADGPLRGQHKGTPTWHPSGRWLVVAAEMKAHQGGHDISTPGHGLFTDLWAVSADGRQWYQLTHYASSITSTSFKDAPAGALMPRFSGKTSRLIWSERIGADAAHPLGIWQLAVADFAFGPKGAELRNKQVFSPGKGQATFYAPSGFSATDRQLLVTSDNDTPGPAFMHVQAWPIGTQILTDVTKGKRQFEDHGILSPDGNLIAYSSTEGEVPVYASKPGEPPRPFATDVWIMRSDGTQATRVTYFNQPGHPQFLPGRHRVMPLSWTDERTLLFDVAPIDGNRYDWAGNRIYRLDLP